MNRRSKPKPRVYWSERWRRWYVALPSGYVCAHGASWREALRLAGEVVRLLPRQWATVEALEVTYFIDQDGQVKARIGRLVATCSSTKV